MSEAKKLPESKGHIISDDLEIIDIFRSLVKNKEKVWTWQQKKNADGGRPVHFAMIRKIDPIKKLVELLPTNEDGFHFTKGEDIFLYSADKNVAAKFSVREHQEGFISFSVPKHLNYLSEELAAKLSIVEKEDEGANSHLRDAPRKQAQDGQMITVKKVLKDNALGASRIYTLYDISQGGMGLKCFDPAEFKVGDIVHAVDIDGKPLAAALIGTVVAVRQIEEEYETFKIGVKFGS